MGHVKNIQGFQPPQMIVFVKLTKSKGSKLLLEALQAQTLTVMEQVGTQKSLTLLFRTPTNIHPNNPTACLPVLTKHHDWSKRLPKAIPERNLHYTASTNRPVLGTISGCKAEVRILYLRSLA